MTLPSSWAEFAGGRGGIAPLVAEKCNDMKSRKWQNINIKNVYTH